MVTSKSQHQNRTPAAPQSPAASAWERARAYLEQVKAHIAGQINTYPPPIPACDAQFNYLLEQRGAIGEELGRLEAARQKSLGETDGKQALAAFIASSQFIDEAAAREIGESAPA